MFEENMIFRETLMSKMKVCFLSLGHLHIYTRRGCDDEVLADDGAATHELSHHVDADHERELSELGRFTMVDPPCLIQ